MYDTLIPIDNRHSITADGKTQSVKWPKCRNRTRKPLAIPSSKAFPMVHIAALRITECVMGISLRGRFPAREQFPLSQGPAPATPSMAICEPKSADTSCGFLPGRSARDALRKSREYLNAGYIQTADMVPEKLFDTVNRSKPTPRQCDTRREPDSFTMRSPTPGSRCPGCGCPPG